MQDENRQSGRANTTTPAASAGAAELPLHEKRQRLLRILRGHHRLLVAFSAGADSTLLLRAALDELGPQRVLAVTGVSPSLARRELQEAHELAARLGARHRLLETHEIEDPNYASNPQNRCYFCKSELFDRLRELAAAEGFDAIADGTNLDDAHDVRPGRQAVREHGICSPLLEAGFTKQDVRALSRQLGLPTWDKPEMPCLASRIPYGSRVDVDKLRQVETAEEALRGCGIGGGRVRHHGEIARIELPPDQLGRLADAVLRNRLVEGVRAAGFEYVTLDLEGYRRGRQNEAAQHARVEWRCRPPTPE